MEAGMMQRDIRGPGLYQETEAIYKALRQPGTGQVSDALEIHASPGGNHAVFSGAILDNLEDTTTRICQVDLRSGDIRVLTFGLGTDRLPKYSPDGQRV